MTQRLADGVGAAFTALAFGFGGRKNRIGWIGGQRGGLRIRGLIWRRGGGRRGRLCRVGRRSRRGSRRSVAGSSRNAGGRRSAKIFFLDLRAYERGGGWIVGFLRRVPRALIVGDCYTGFDAVRPYGDPEVLAFVIRLRVTGM